VIVLRAQQSLSPRPPDSLVREYIQLGEKYAQTLGAPSLIIVGGVMGTGKSTLATAIADAFGAELLSTDSLRRTVLGLSKAPANYNESNYTPKMRLMIYDEMLKRANKLLSEGLSVVLDGAFLTSSLRSQAHEIAQQASAVSVFVLCTCSRHLALSRIQERAQLKQSDSEARPELYDRQARELERPHAGEPAIRIDTSGDASNQLAAVCRSVRKLLFEN
jgi:predicted kinase